MVKMTVTPVQDELQCTYERKKKEKQEERETEDRRYRNVTTTSQKLISQGGIALKIVNLHLEVLAHCVPLDPVKEDGDLSSVTRTLDDVQLQLLRLTEMSTDARFALNCLRNSRGVVSP